MDRRISVEVGQTMFWTSVQSGMSSGWVWRRSPGGPYITFFDSGSNQEENNCNIL